MLEVDKEHGFYINLKKTNAVANIIELCFVDNQAYADLYKKVGVNKVVKSIVEGITGQAIKEENKPKYSVNYCKEF